MNRKQIRGFADLEFIAKAENIAFVGETGRGKTELACGPLLKVLEIGYRCQFIKAQDLFDEMYASLADRSLQYLAWLFPIPTQCPSASFSKPTAR